jgi:hypothetical protein
MIKMRIHRPGTIVGRLIAIIVLSVFSAQFTSHTVSLAAPNLPPYKVYLPLVSNRDGNTQDPVGNQYYVSTIGSDSNPGTISQPWETLQKAVNVVVAGDTVFIRGGTYSERMIINARSGVQDNYITFQAYPNEIPVIDGTGISIAPSAGLVDVRNSSYIKIDGLTINNSDDAGIYVRSSVNILVTNNHTSETNSSGIGVWSSDHVLIDHNKIVNARNVTSANGGHEESLSIASTTNFEVSNNEVSLSGLTGYLGNEGIDVKEASRFGKVHHNYIHDFPSEGGAIYVDAWDAVSPTLSNVDIYANRLGNTANGIIIGSERGGTAENINVYNNVVYNVGATGIGVIDTGSGPHGPRKNINIFNNTVVGARWNGGAGIYLTSQYMENVIIRNNIVFFNNWNGEITAGDVTLLSQIKADHNLVFGPKHCANDHPNCIEISNINDPVNYPNFHDNRTSDPNFVSVATLDFHLQSSSPAVDMGTDLSWLVVDDFDGILRPQQSAFDIGAFE